MTEEFRKRVKRLLYEEREKIDAQRKYYEAVKASNQDYKNDAVLLKYITEDLVHRGEFSLDFRYMIYVYSGSFSKKDEILESENEKGFHHNKYSYIIYPSSSFLVMKRQVSSFEKGKIVIKRYPPVDASNISSEYFALLLDYDVIEAQQILTQKYR